MSTLKIHRVNSKKYLIKDGSKVIRSCASFKEAQNSLINEDLMMLDNVNEFNNAELEDMDIVFLLQEVA